MQKNNIEVFRIGSDTQAEFYGSASYLKYFREDNSKVNYIYLKTFTGILF